MKYRKGLIDWLKWWMDGRSEVALNMMKSGELADVASTKVMLDECRHAGLIHATGITLYDNTMPRYIHYVLTADGKRELGITDTAAATAQTEPADTGTGYATVLTPLGFNVYAPSGGFMCHVEQKDAHLSFEYILNTETATLRSQLASAQERVATLEAIAAQMGKQIDDAGYYLGQASDKDENSNRAYNILKGYAQAD